MFLVFFIHIYLKDIYSMSHFYFCLPWLESCIPVIFICSVPPLFSFWNITVLWSNTTQIVITHICVIKILVSGKKKYLDTIYTSCNNVAPVTNLCLGRATMRIRHNGAKKKSCSWNIKTHYLRFKHFIITITDDPSPC